MEKAEKNSINYDGVLKVLITALFIILPFLDILRTTFIKDVELFNIAIIELVNILLIGLSFLLTLLKRIKTNKKDIFLLFIFLALSFVYIYLHYQNIIKFDVSIFTKAKFNLIVESFYICRVYILPLILLFVLSLNKDIFNRDYYLKIAKIVIIIISFSIVILNIFKLSYISYSANHSFNVRNMFDYFLYNGDFKMLSSRGWFDSANELSATLLMLLPFNIYMLYKENKKFNVVLLFVQILSMILLGTRTSAFGSIAVCVFSLGMYVAVKYIQKESVNKLFAQRFAVIILLCTAYLSISPTMLARINDGFVDFSVKDTNAYQKLKDIKNIDDSGELEELIKKYSDEYKVNEEFLKLYPVKNDMQFWLRIFNRDKALNNNSRVLKVDIISRIYERNNNDKDKYFGIGYTLNFMDLERDYVYQYYLFGIFGLLLFIVPYILVIVCNAFKALFNLKANLKFRTLLVFMSPFMGLILAYLSGHVFGWVSPMMFLVMSIAMLSVTVSYNISTKGNVK